MTSTLQKEKHLPHADETALVAALPSRAHVKQMAGRLRSALKARSIDVGYSMSLELLAQQFGFRNWNILSSKLPDDSAASDDGAEAKPLLFPVMVGQRFEGRYKGTSFACTLLGITLTRNGLAKVVLHLDVPLDVVTFESFSSHRTRLQMIIDPEGYSCTALGKPDGRFHLFLRP